MQSFKRCAAAADHHGMGSLRRLAVLAALAASAGCSVTTAEDQPAGLADPFPDLSFGPLAGFPVGEITEVETPRAVFVTWIDGELTVFHRKDPNIGCRLQLAADVDPADSTATPIDAVYWDPCHGSAYDERGIVIGQPDANPMYRLDVAVRDGEVVWSR